MTQILVVTKSFLQFTRGNIISDTSKIQAVLLSDHKRFVMKVSSQVPSKG